MDAITAVWCAMGVVWLARWAVVVEEEAEEEEEEEEEA
jgi:hypothetical protein